MIALETPELPASLELPSWLAASLAELLRQRERLPHALLIEGPAGIGKGLLASAFAAALLCESANHQRGACQRCPACGWYRSGNHPDFRRLSPKTDEEGRPEGRSERSRREIKIDQVRGLAEFVALGAHRAGRKIVIVEPASALNVTAANALLKTLEEPDRATLFLLVAARGAPVPATIRSRCVAFPVATPTRDQSLGWLCERLPAEERAGAQRWLDLADGAPLTALGFTEPGDDHFDNGGTRS